MSSYDDLRINPSADPDCRWCDGYLAGASGTTSAPAGADPAYVQGMRAAQADPADEAARIYRGATTVNPGADLLSGGPDGL